MAPKTAKGEPQKVISFKAYETKEKCRIQTAYPFLSPTQIKGKIREGWNKLGHREKQNYMTYKFEKTPTRKGSTPSKKRKSDSNLQLSKLSKTKKLYDSKAAEYINSKQDSKASEGRDFYAEDSENEFIESFNDFRNRRSDSGVHYSSSPVFKEDKISTYQTHGNVGIKANTPDSKRTATQGILKTSDSAKKSHLAHVSFNSPMEMTDLHEGEDQNDSPMEFTSDDFQELDDSDDDERFLIRREDTNTEDNDNQEDEMISETNNDKAAGSHETEKFKDLDEKNRETNMEKNREDREIDLHEDKCEETDQNDARQTRNRHSLSLSKKGGLDDPEVSPDKEHFFKSPLPSSKKTDKNSIKKRKMTKAEGRKQTPDMSQIRDKPSSQITPHVGHCTPDPDEYTTPQMDEVLQQLTLDQVVKAPQKHKHSREAANERARIQAQLVGRQVNRSLLSPDKAASDAEKDSQTGKGTAKTDKRKSKGKVEDQTTKKTQDTDRQSRSNRNATGQSKSEQVSDTAESKPSRRSSRTKGIVNQNDTINNNQCDDAEIDSKTQGKRLSRRRKASNDIKGVNHSDIDPDMDMGTENTQRPSRKRRMSNDAINNNKHGFESEMDTQPANTKKSSNTRSNKDIDEYEIDNIEVDTSHIRSKRTKRMPNDTFDNDQYNDNNRMDTDGMDTRPFSPTRDHSGQSNTDYNNNMTANEDLSVLDMNPCGDAGGSTSVVDYQRSRDLKGGDAIGGHKDYKKIITKKHSKDEITEDEKETSSSYPSSTEDSQPPSSCNLSLESSPQCFNVQEALDLKKKMEGRCDKNPVLERALKLLQLTSNTNINTASSPCEHEEEEELNMCSPGLLSPASSGVSELSSVSSSTSRVSDDANSIFNLQTSQGTQESGLFQLFTDLTPPDQKTSGLYKTKRLLTSSTDQENVTLKEFFNEDADIFA